MDIYCVIERRNAFSTCFCKHILRSGTCISSDYDMLRAALLPCSRDRRHADRLLSLWTDTSILSTCRCAGSCSLACPAHCSSLVAVRQEVVSKYCSFIAHARIETCFGNPILILILILILTDFYRKMHLKAPFIMLVAM